MANPEFEKFKGRNWYHQRFDGSPMFLFMVGEAETRKEERKRAGMEASWRICFFDEGKADWFLDQEDIDRGTRIFMDLAEKNENISADFMARWKDDENKCQRYFDQFDAKKLKSLDDEELAGEFEKYHDLYLNRFSSSSIIDHFALGTDNIIADMIRQEAGPFAKESEFTNVFSILTAPVHQSFINTAELELLKIALEVKNGKDIKSDEIQNQLIEHQKKYFWTNNNYVKSRVLSVSDFEEEIASWLKGGADLEEQIKLIEATPTNSRNAKEKVLASLSEKLKRLIKISEDFTNWQDERKRSTYLSTFVGSEILGEMGRRRGVDLELLKYLVPREVYGWFMDSKVRSEDLAKRKEKSVVICEEDSYSIYTEDMVEELRDIMLGSPEASDIQDIRGLVACTGRAVGKVKILMSAEEMDKIEEGDVLVAVMTRPDYVQAMKKASAIITDEGGITSHAAIVSRELGTPCIIGTKIATKVFKDGDVVEVNANHNWIRKTTID